MSKSYDRWKQRPRSIEFIPSMYESRQWWVKEKDNLGHIRVGEFQGTVLATHCAMFSCGHLWHGEVCTECPPSIATHVPREWPGHIT